APDFFQSCLPATRKMSLPANGCDAIDGECANCTTSLIARMRYWMPAFRGHDIEEISARPLWGRQRKACWRRQQQLGTGATARQCKQHSDGKRKRYHGGTAIGQERQRH